MPIFLLLAEETSDRPETAASPDPFAPGTARGIASDESAFEGSDFRIFVSFGFGDGRKNHIAPGTIRKTRAIRKNNPFFSFSDDHISSCLYPLLFTDHPCGAKSPEADFVLSAETDDIADSPGLKPVFSAQSIVCRDEAAARSLRYRRFRRLTLFYTMRTQPMDFRVSSPAIGRPGRPATGERGAGRMNRGFELPHLLCVSRSAHD